METNYSGAPGAVSGVLVIDKPVGLTSHDVVQVVRKGTNIRRAGHTGTLDPRASGVLVVLIGPAVRLSEYVSASDKRYQAVIELGVTTDTFDADGTVTSSAPVNTVSYTHLRAHETVLDLVCRLLLEKKKKNNKYKDINNLRENTKHSIKRDY